MNRNLVRKQRGTGFIEVLIALAILGIVAVVFLGGLGISLKTVFISDESSTALALAQSQMEYVKSQEYSGADPDNEVIYNKTAEIPGYYIMSIHRDGSIADDVDGVVGVPWDPVNGTASYNDTGIQKIIVIIYHPYDAAHPDARVFTLEDYKVDR